MDEELAKKTINNLEKAKLSDVYEALRFAKIYGRCETVEDAKEWASKPVGYMDLDLAAKIIVAQHTRLYLGILGNERVKAIRWINENTELCFKNTQEAYEWAKEWLDKTV